MQTLLGPTTLNEITRLYVCSFIVYQRSGYSTNKSSAIKVQASGTMIRKHGD